MQLELSSSQEFIRALKAPKDPPKPGSALKVDLARAAWELESLFIPSKAEVIVEWALQVLKSAEIDVKIWTLLDDILSNTSAPAWLNGVVNRVAVLPVFTSLLHSLAIRLRSVTDALEPALFTSATRVARILLPLASLKTSCDVVAGCFWEVLGLFSSQDVPDDRFVPVLDLCEVVVSTLETSFANYANKKKIATHLVDHYLNSWLHCLNPASALAKFRHRLFDVCNIIVFSPEHTRAIFQHHPDPHPVLIATSFSPRVFAAYISALRTHKLSVFLDQGGSGLQKRIRTAAREVFVRSVAGREWSVVAQLARYAEDLQVVDDDWAEEFGALAESAVQALDNKWSEEQARIAIHICETLGCILRCHVHVVEPILGRLLSGLCDAPHSVLPAAGSVLELVLDYHSKARTLNTFLPQLANALASREYQAACTGPVFEPTFAARLRRSISAFITPGQILPCTQALLSEVPLIPSSEPPRKKRRSSARGSNANESESAIRLGLVSRLLVDVLASLPVRTLKNDVVELLRRSVDEFDERLGGLVNPTSWAEQVSLAAVLRIRYGLRQARCPVRTRRVLTQEESVAEDDLLLRLIEDDTLSAELVTEAVRVLAQGERSREHICNVWSRALARVQRDSAAQQNSSWNGSLAHLENHVWFPLLFLLFDRQLHLIEFSMNADQLKIILDILVHMNRNLDRSDAITAAHLFNKTISLAQFWELPNLRKALNDKITLDTSSLDQVDLHKALKALRKGRQSKHAGSHDTAISMYHIAALAPPDYLDRPAKAALLARAACADVLATRAADKSIVRVVLRQLSSGSGVLPEEYIRYLLDPLLQNITEAPCNSGNPDDTLPVLGASFRVYARLARDSDASSDLVSVLQSIETLELFELPRWEDPAAIVSIRATLTCLDTIVETWGKASTIPDTIRACVVKILDQIRNRVEQPSQVTDLLIEAARTLAACEHWFARDATQASRRARVFLRTLLEQNSVATEALLRLLTEEIQNADEDVRLLLAAFTLNARAHGSDTLRAETSFGEACRRISLEQHGTLTNEITTLLQDSEPDHVYRVSTIRMASLALRFAPEGTSKARRRTTTTVLHALGRLPQLSVFQEACAVFIAEICNERANALTAPDMTAIWILLDRATISPDAIPQRIYSSTVSSLNSLVRFRRDLLTPTLAQLSALLARLIRAQRLRTSPAIGAPQHNVEQATELARLLVGLSAKTLIRPNNNRSEQTAKAESLARPFARHAPYVLVAYAESAADMSAAVRHALKPGLFALCAMCGVPARDMIMVTMLDTVEKEVFGSVWREWEAQKYTGKG